jgi:CPA2 family monovalent cation:H+ antiporter-2
MMIVGVIIMIFGGRLVPRLLKHVAATHSRELFTLSILVIALGIAIGSARFFGVSMALGAFLAGVVVGQSDFSLRAATDALPMRDAFAVLFFVSVGMLFDPAVILQSPLLVLLTLAVVMVVTPLLSMAIILLLGYPLRMALKIAFSLAQIGEFSFILTNLGIQLDMLSQSAIHVLVAVSIVSISLSPLLQNLVDPVAKQVSGFPWAKKLMVMRKPFSFREAADSSKNLVSVESEYRAVIVGFGPVGQTVAKLLSENGIVPTIIELNHETIVVIRRLGFSAVLGDANMPETLLHAGIKSSVSLILSASTIRDAAEIVRSTRALNPKIRVIVRCTYLRERETLLQFGADSVFTSEGEVALAMAESLLRDLGATAEQVDRERQKLRSELFG